jgi:hypothetical protein
MTKDNLTKSFEILEPPKRTAKLLDQEVDVTVIPAITAFKFVQFSKKYGNSKLDDIAGAGIDEDMLNEIMVIIGDITSRSNPKVTKEWLLENLSMPDLTRFMTFLFEGMGDKKAAGPEGKQDAGKLAAGKQAGKN